MRQYRVQANEIQRYVDHHTPISHRRLGNARFREKELNIVVGSTHVI